MCEHCHSFPHLSGCPNDDKDSWGTCKYCGREILEKEDYIENGMEVVHLECLKDMIESDPREALDMLGVYPLKAGE